MGGRSGSFKRKSKNTKIKIMSEQDFLDKRGVGSPISGWGDDKWRSNRQIKTIRGKEKFRKEAKKNIDSYHEKRVNAIDEYQKLVKKGAVRPPTQLEKSFSDAQGNGENRSVQAARRILKKRGYDWKTGKRLSTATRPGPARLRDYRK